MAYSTLTVEFNDDNETEFMLKFKIFKKEFEIGCSELANIWNLHYRGCLFDGKKSLEEWGPNVKQQAFELFNIQRISRKKVLVNIFSKEIRVLHYLLNYVLMPRSCGHSHVKDEDVITMWAMVNDIKINWTYFIVQHMLRFKKGLSTSGFGYVCLWTRIFRYLNIDVSGEEVKRMVPTSIINIRTIYHMGRGIEEGEEQQEPPPPQEQAPQEQAGPSEQPSMRDIMRVLQRIERKQARMDRRLHRIEQYMEIEEDEDEDQD
ncbi:hypothetical protein PIB30_106421 [Stylosanthes scabra]|uniref:Uncharacterized protein n=1 Tax=Stylosanthes scabra TaxID=79078 RepID=A0ABU6YXP0_9FABA|nr:hypothetical protein [Stylosanthes scabra]